MIICGIYKYTSPSGKTYIGSSKNIYKRIKIMSTQSILLKDKAHYARNLKNRFFGMQIGIIHRFYKLGRYELQ